MGGVEKRYPSRRIVGLLASLAVAAWAMAALAASARASISSHSVAYVFENTLFPCEEASGCGMNDSTFPGGSLFTNAFGMTPGVGETGTYTPAGGQAVTLTNVTLARLDEDPHALDGFDTAILYQLCDIGSSENAAALAQVNAFLESGHKVMIFDADGCAPSSHGSPDWSGFALPFTTDNPGPQGAAGEYSEVESSSLTTGLSPGPVEGDAVGDANIFTTYDPRWYRAIAAKNTDGVSGIVEAYAETGSGGLALYSGEDFWYTDGPSAHLQQVFDDMLDQQWNPDGLPNTTPACTTCTTPPASEFVTVYSKDLPHVFRLHTPTPSLFEFPFGLELVPALNVRARVQPSTPAPQVNEAQGPSFLTFGPLSFSVFDFKWHGSPGSGGSAPASGLFDGGQLGYEAQFGLLSAPAVDPGEGKPLEAAVSVPVASIEVSLPAASLPAIGAATPEVAVGGDVHLNVKLYIEQGVTYAGEKLAEGAVGTLSAVVTDGVDAPLVVDAMEAQMAAELAQTAAQYAKVVLHAKLAWNLIVNQGVPFARLLGQLVSVEAPHLVGEVAGWLAKKLKQAVKWVVGGVVKVASGVYKAGVWVVQTGGAIVSGAGKAISSGWHFVTGIFDARRPFARAQAFESLPIQTLRLSALRSKRGLGFGPHVLTRALALSAARSLVKYGLRTATVRPLLVNRFAPRARQSMCVVGGRLTHAGTAVLELSGPGYRAQTLIRTRLGVGGACIRLPRRMTAGRWVVGVVDYNAHTHRSGVLLDVYPFTIESRHHTAHRRHRR